MYLQPIEPLAGDNIGSLVSIRVARKATITAMQQPVRGIVYGNISFLPGTGFVAWAATLNTAAVDNNTRTTREGSPKTNRLKFSIPKGRASLSAMFEQACEDEFIVLFRDANGTQKIFGLPHTPVRFRFSYNSGSSVPQKNGYDCEFFYEGPENIFEYNGTIATAPAGPAPAIVRFGATIETAVPIASLQPGQTLTILSDFAITDFFTTTT